MKIGGTLEPKVTVCEAWESKNPNKFGFSLGLHYLCHKKSYSVA